MSLTKTTVHFRCMGCQTLIVAQGANIGRRMKCPYCSHILFVPSVNSESSTIESNYRLSLKRIELNEEYSRHLKTRRMYYLISAVSGIIAAIPGLALFILVCSSWPQNGIWLLLWGMVAAVVACSCLAKAKGRSFMWGLWGIAGFIGMAVPVLLYDIRQEHIAGINQALNRNSVDGRNLTE